ncbi:hypothetical protein [Rhizobium sp. SAFR-030]|uniref:hypothetical protein n=1 Tax=Rhizobium sp. SAFR-030 TaxID=3387277 RepID=UPI003F7F6867
MKPVFHDGFLGLECVGMEVREVMKVANLMAIAAQSVDQMDNRALPGIQSAAEMIAERLDGLHERIDVLVNEWQLERRPGGKQ